MSKNIDCEVVKDLLPLYYDKVVSEKTESVVKEHLEFCKGCKAEYKKMFSELPIESNLVSTQSKFICTMKKQKNKSRIKIIISAVLSLVIVVGAFAFMLNVPVKNGNMENFAVNAVYNYDYKDADNRNCRGFYLIAHRDIYSGESRGQLHYEESVENGKTALNICTKDTIISYKIDDNELIDYQIPISKEYDILKFNDVEIWNKEKDGYKYSDFVEEKTKVDYYKIDTDKNILSVWYTAEDSTDEYIYYDYCKLWDLDGKLLFSGTTDEFDQSSYSKMFNVK